MNRMYIVALNATLLATFLGQDMDAEPAVPIGKVILDVANEYYEGHKWTGIEDWLDVEVGARPISSFAEALPDFQPLPESDSRWPLFLNGRALYIPKDIDWIEVKEGGNAGSDKYDDVDSPKPHHPHRREHLLSGLLGSPTDKRTIPTKGVNDSEEVAHLERAVSRLLSHNGPLQASPLYGMLDQETLVKLHRIHTAHHLSFLIPSA